MKSMVITICRIVPVSDSLLITPESARIFDDPHRFGKSLCAQIAGELAAYRSLLRSSNALDSLALALRLSSAFEPTAILSKWKKDTALSSTCLRVSRHNSDRYVGEMPGQFVDTGKAVRKAT